MYDKNGIKKRIAFLAAEIRRHQDLYYKEAGPEISDSEYDALFDELTVLEKKHPELALRDSPTKRVGSDLDNEFPEVSHPFPMLSLDKVYTEDELRKWMEKLKNETAGEISFVIEEKIDGSTIVLYYEEGLLVRAVTRGDGHTGNDITENIRTIRDIPLRLAEPVTSVFRGEIYIAKTDFEKLNRDMENIYANPRNFAAGCLRRKKSREVAGIPLKSFIYEGFFEADSINEHIKVLHRLTELGFKVGPMGFFRDYVQSSAGSSPRESMHPSNKDTHIPDHGSTDSLYSPGSADFSSSSALHPGENNGYDALFQKHGGWVHGSFKDIAPFIEKKLVQRETLDYEIDGLVVKVNEYHARKQLGYTAHHPRWAIAYKFEAPQAVSRILDIEVQVGRTGRITPVARIKPVWISGSTVSNVTLHNQDYITSLDAAVGDTVAVSRRGDVIPAVEDVLEKNDHGNKRFTIPQRCPVCGTGIIQDGAHHFCPNRHCPARVFGRISFFAGRGQMDIENLGSETVKKLIELELIKDIPDIYSFDAHSLLKEDGFGEKKVSLIKEGIDRSREKPFAVVLASLGLDEVGPKVVELLIEAGYSSIEKLISTAKKSDQEIFTGIQGIGPKTAEKIVQHFNDPFVLGMIQRLKEAGLCFVEESGGAEETLKQVFEGEVWCVTGSFEHFTPREKAMEEVKKRGGRVTSSVTGKTTHLLVGENPGSKLQKAKILHTKIVTEKEFLSRLEPE